MLKTILTDKHQTDQKEKVPENDVCFLGIVLDATLSFASVFPQVYYFMERLLICLRQFREQKEELTFEYALTLIKDKPEMISFFRDIVTDDEDELLESLSEIEFSGGGADGKENLTDGLRLLLETMEQKTASGEQRGLLLISDAIACDNGEFPDLTRSAGLRFAYIFSGNDEYLPQFLMVDKNGHLTANEQNTGIYAGLEELLTETEEQAVRLAEELAEEMVMRFS